MKEKTFKWLNSTQFFGALNDNIFKFLIIFNLITIYGNQNKGFIISLASFIFVLPFLIFSLSAGKIADNHSKTKIIQFTKISELLIMILGSIGFYFQSSIILLVSLFLMSMQSAFFGPAKYGIIPELINSDDLSKANSLLTAFTFLAIILGSFFASFISDILNQNYFHTSLFCIFIAIAGLSTSLKIKKTKAISNEKKYSFKKIFKILNTDTYLFMTVIGISLFDFAASFIQMNIIEYGIENLKLNQIHSGYLFFLVAIGIGIGSIIAGKLSDKNIEFGIIPIGAFGMALTTFLLFFMEPNIYKISTILFFTGIFAGLYIVPLNSFLQYQSPEKYRGKIISLSNLFSFTLILIAAIIFYFVSNILKLNATYIFLIISSIVTIITFLSLIILPDFLIKFTVITILKIFYKIKIYNKENLPIENGALIISNHVSWIDALILSACTKRRIKFIMFRDIYEKKPFKYLFKLFKVIPISETDSTRQKVKSIKDARQALDEKYLLCIFAEGALTRTGYLNEFKRGFEVIMKNKNYPIIPIYMDGLWGSIFSYYNGKILSTLPRQIPFPVRVIIGSPMKSNVNAYTVRNKILELSSFAETQNINNKKTLSELFIKIARKNWKKNALNDSFGKKFTYGKSLLMAYIIKDKILTNKNSEKNIGILLPTSSIGTLVNIAISLNNQTSVNLNYTCSKKTIENCIEKCNLKTIITSKKFIEKFKELKNLKNIIFLEEIIKEHNLSLIQKAGYYIKTKYFPLKTLNKNFNTNSNATIIFSSGSTGNPKGIMLSHFNIISNINSLKKILHTNSKDNLSSSLPYFHSFGFTVGLWLPLLSEFSVSYHTNPLDYKNVIKSIKKNKSTILITTPTFLSKYIQKIEKDEFNSLKFIMTGAEKLKLNLVEECKRKIGLIPFEGYGATELSPVTTLNIPDFILKNEIQKGNKIGSVGKPLPGISFKIIDINTGKMLPPNKTGMLFIKGPNVMKGYLNEQNKTEEVLKDNWYNTNDIAKYDEDGFITIVDRLSRFSKIAGEMVPHEAIENIILDSLNSVERTVAVTSIPDKIKGEKIIVLHSKSVLVSSIQKIIEKCDLPNLWKPNKKDYYEIKEFPILGSGKLDILGLKKIALNFNSKS